jgi:hypothetical protein
LKNNQYFPNPPIRERTGEDFPSVPTRTPAREMEFAS